MNRRTLSILLLAGLLTTLVTAGCTSTASKTAGTEPRDAGTQQAPSQPAATVDEAPRDGEMAWSTMAFPTGNPATSAVSVKKGLPREVVLNKPFEYEIVVTNLTSMPLKEVVVADIVDTGLNIKGSTPQGQPGEGGRMSWRLGDLGANESKTIRVTATASREGSVGSCATVAYASELCSTVAVVQPKLGITKSGPAEVLKCDPIVYKVEVRNSGTGAVRGVTIRDELPDGLTTATGQRVWEQNVGTLAAGQSRSFDVPVKATQRGRFTNKATVAGEGDLTAASNEVTTVVREPKLTITKECPKNEFIGRNADFVITVKNEGDGVARDLVVEDVLAPGTTFVRASDGGTMVGNKVTWRLGNLEPNGTRRIVATLTRDTAGTLRNAATARAFCADAVTAACETVFTGIPAILLEVVDLEDPIEVGNTVTYVITATNQGSAPDSNVRIVVTLESEMEFVRATGATAATAQGNRVTFAPLPVLATKTEAEWRVTVRAREPGDVRFAVSMMSDQLTRPVEETEATNYYR